MKTRLQEMRKRAGYKSAKEFAEKHGYNVITYTNYEQGKREMTVLRAWEFADILNCSLDELAGREFNPPEYTDERQAELNGHYKSLNEASKSAIVDFVKSYAADPARRVERVDEKNNGYQAAI